MAAEEEDREATPQHKEPDWRKHPAKHFLKKLFRDKTIPVEYSKNKWGGPKRVWNDHCKGHPAFKRMKYNDTFTRRLRDVRDDQKLKVSRASEDKKAFENFRKLCPEESHNHRGEPRWEGSRAQELLREDIDAGLHKDLEPNVFHAQRPEYMEFKLGTFRDHIYQEKKLRRYLNWLEQEQLKAAGLAEGILVKDKKKQKKRNEDDISIGSYVSHDSEVSYY